jgi:putative PIN family toxin of toxin-antitoxin system
MLPRIVLDTNLIISAVLIADSIPRKTFNRAVDSCMPLLSAPVLLELIDAFHRAKFDKYVTESGRMKFLIGFLKITELVEITETINICRDKRDDKLLELAISGNADFLLTGDEDLLALNPFRNVKILNPQSFLKTIF